MSRAPARASRAPVPAEAHCPNNDCQRAQAEALTRLADHFDHLFGPPGAAEEHQGEAMKALRTVGEIGGKWLRFCTFISRWFPRLWVFLTVIAGLLFKGGTEAGDQLIAALTAYLTSQTGAGG